MPDLDIVARHLKQPWRAPYRLMKGGHPPEVVAESLLKALAATVRDNGGMPGFGPLLTASTEAHSNRDDGANAKTLAEVGRAIEQEFGQRPEVKLLARAAQRNLAQVQAGRALPGPLPLAREHLQSLLRHNFFSKVTARLVGERGRFANVQEAREFENSLWALAEPQLVELARRLIANPTASKLRAPKSRRRQRTTAELLEVPLSDGIQP